MGETTARPHRTIASLQPKIPRCAALGVLAPCAWGVLGVLSPLEPSLPHVAEPSFLIRHEDVKLKHGTQSAGRI